MINKYIYIYMIKTYICMHKHNKNTTESMCIQVQWHSWHVCISVEYDIPRVCRCFFFHFLQTRRTDNAPKSLFHFGTLFFFLFLTAHAAHLLIRQFFCSHLRTAMPCGMHKYVYRIYYMTMMQLIVRVVMENHERQSNFD